MTENKKLSKIQKVILKEIGSSNFISSIRLSYKVSEMIEGARQKFDLKQRNEELGWKWNPINHRKRFLNHQTDSFRASFSRSLKRLKDRELIKKDYENRYSLTLKGYELVSRWINID